MGLGPQIGCIMNEGREESHVLSAGTGRGDGK